MSGPGCLVGVVATKNPVEGFGMVLSNLFLALFGGRRLERSEDGRMSNGVLGFFENLGRTLNAGKEVLL